MATIIPTEPISTAEVIALPPTLIVLAPEEDAKRLALIDQINTCLAKPMTVDDLAAASEAHEAAHRWLKQLEEHREKLKRPILDLGNAIQATANEARRVLTDRKERLAAAISKCQREENARIEAERKRIAEEDRKEQERRDAEAREAQAKLDRAAQERDEMEALPGETIGPVSSVGTVLVRPVVAPKPEMPALIKTSVRTTEKKVLHVDDESLIPFEVNGVRLWKTLDRSAVETLLKAKVPVPGCRLVDDIRYGAKGR